MPISGDTDGYEFDLIKQDEKDTYRFELPDFPSDEARFGVRKGDLVKLIFRYRDWIEKKDHTITSERMWVIVTYDSGPCLRGVIDNSPHFTELLKEGDTVNFHPLHIIQIWND